MRLTVFIVQKNPSPARLTYPSLPPPPTARCRFDLVNIISKVRKKEDKLYESTRTAPEKEMKETRLLGRCKEWRDDQVFQRMKSWRGGEEGR